MRTVRPLVWGRVSAFLADPATQQGLGAKGACCEQPCLLGHRSGFHIFSYLFLVEVEKDGSKLAVAAPQQGAQSSPRSELTRCQLELCRAAKQSQGLRKRQCMARLSAWLERLHNVE